MRGWGTVRKSVSEEAPNMTGIFEATGPTRNIVLVAESLELALGPRVQDPVLDVEVGILSLVTSLVPFALNLRDQRVLVGLGGGLGLDALSLQILLQGVCVPRVVGRDDVVVPVVLDQLLEVLAVGGSGVGDIVVGKPALELGLVPLVVGCVVPCYAMIPERAVWEYLDLPALENQELATAPWAARAVRTAGRKRIMAVFR